MSRAWFRSTTGKWVFRSYDPREETPPKQPKGRGVAGGAPTISGGGRILSEDEKLGYLIQTGKNFETFGEVQAHMKSRDQRFAEKGDEYEEELETIKESTGVDPKKDIQEAKQAGELPGMVGTDMKRLRKDLTRPLTDSPEA